MHRPGASPFLGLMRLLVCIVTVWGCRARADVWVTAYYAGWMQNYLAASNVDFSAVSHIIHFALVPNPDGTLDAESNVVTPPNVTDLVKRAHAAGKKVLISIGGANSQFGFQGASDSAHRVTFISNIVDFVSLNGYDGADIDWEPLVSSDVALFTNLVSGLRTALNSPSLLLTAATASQPVMFSSLQDQFDQINLMTYDLSGPWAGWVTWFNAPLFNGGYRFPSTGGLVPSTEGMVNDFIAAGVAATKLGIGIDFYGVIWAGGSGTSAGGATLPRQTWVTAPTTTPVAYYSLMTSFYQPQRYFWDTNAQAAYLSVDNSGSSNDRFISYDDEHSCQVKISYARNRGLGGVMIWELGGGYRATQPAGQRDPLLQAIKQALATPRFTEIQTQGTDVRLSFTTLPLASYRIQYASDPTALAWGTITNAVPGNGGILQLYDPSGLNSTQRFYRVRTPP